MRAVLTEKDIETIKTKTSSTTKQKDNADNLKPDDYASQIGKFIPAEIIAFYVAMFAAATAVKDTLPSYQLVTTVMFFMGLIATLIFTFATGKKDLKSINAPGLYSKALISTGAFIVWAFTFGAPFTALSWYNVFYGTLALGFYTLVAPKIYELVPVSSK
jgi:hypothetical protein